MQNIKRLVAIGRLGAVIGAASLVGCSSLSNDSDEARSEGRVKDDKNITERVENKLESDPVYKFDQVEVRTYGGTVQLSGFVDTELQSQRAAEHARGISGVTHLINGLAIKPPPPAKTEVSVQTLTPATETVAPTGKASGEALTPPPGATSTASPNSTTKNY